MPSRNVANISGFSDEVPGNTNKRLPRFEETEHLRYLLDMLSEMRLQALSLKRETLAYLIEMAMLEALQQEHYSRLGSNAHTGTE